MENKKAYTIALAGNPNVGKSTVFNALTGLNQHTGNWPGKTVTSAKGSFVHKGQPYTIVDIPGMYSLIAGSADEDVARDFICFEKPDCTVVVADATCLERNLNLVLQILEVTNRVVVCVNLLDEAKKKNIEIDIDELSLMLGVPVVGVCARSGIGIDDICDAIYEMTVLNKRTYFSPTVYPEDIEKGIISLIPTAEKIAYTSNSRWMAVRLFDADKSFNNALRERFSFETEACEPLNAVLDKLNKQGYDLEKIKDAVVKNVINRANYIYSKCVKLNNENYDSKDRKLDKLLTSRLTGIPVMLMLLLAVFWLTITGANYPSQLLSEMFTFGEEKLHLLFDSINAPNFLDGILISGMYRTLTWVVSVMLPPMAIFFPLFTLLEDSGYLPRIAFNLDRYFKKSGAHGKQSLTMCMGLGCNACGVTGCRIINSPRERLVAIITNNFVPCNGRFPPPTEE